MVSHVEYAPRRLLRIEKRRDRQTDRQTDRVTDARLLHYAYIPSTFTNHAGQCNMTHQKRLVASYPGHLAELTWYIAQGY